jgi:hypothetical protein
LADPPPHCFSPFPFCTHSPYPPILPI